MMKKMSPKKNMQGWVEGERKAKSRENEEDQPERDFRTIRNELGVVRC